jgi:hypothetical protein
MVNIALSEKIKDSFFWHLVLYFAGTRYVTNPNICTFFRLGNVVMKPGVHLTRRAFIRYFISYSDPDFAVTTADERVHI